MRPDASTSSIAASAWRFLGIEGDADHPMALLGLGGDRDSWDSAEIGRALVRRLQRIDEHPQARTPEADELRVALHVAAAQLKDPSVRASLLNDSDGTAEEGESPGSTHRQDDPLQAPMPTEEARPIDPLAFAPTGSSGVDPGFATAAQHVLASCGGWNAESKRRLGYLARSASVDASVLQRTLVEITRQHEQVAPSMAPRPAAVVNGAAPEDDDGGVSPLSRSTLAGRPLDHRIASPRARAWITIGTFLMLGASLTIALGLLTIVIQEAFSGPAPVQTRIVQRPQGTTPTTPSAPGDAPPPDETGASEPTAGPGLPVQTDGPRLVRYLQALTSDAFATAPDESFEGLAEAIERLSAIWPQLDPEPRAIAPLAVRDAILAASDAERPRASRLIETMLSDFGAFDPDGSVPQPSGMIDSVFVFGISGLLLESPIEPRLERSLRTRLNSIASGVGLGVNERDFEALVAIALTALADKGVPHASDSSGAGPEAFWRTWLVMADALPADRSRDLKLTAIESIVERGEEPTFHRPTGVTIATLVGSLDWRAAGASELGSRLLAWFDDREGFSDEALSVITSELVDGAHLPMLGPDMKLGGSASPDARRALRDRYAVRFGLPQIGDGRLFVAEWVGFANEQLDSSLATGDRDALDAAVRAAFLNAAASLWLDSDEGGARSALEHVRTGLSGFVSGSGGPVSFGNQRPSRADGEWAARYLLARRSADDRTRLLYELENTGGPAGAADADVLAEAASYSTPIEIRRQAQQIVIAYSGRSEVVLGLLEVLPRAAAQSGVSEMIADVTGRVLPDVDDQDWEFEARKALVARALELLAEEEQRYLDVARTALERSVSIRVDALPQPQADPTGDSFGAGGLDSIDAGNGGPDESVPVIEEYVERLLSLCRRYPQRARTFATLTELQSRRVWRERLASGAIAGYVADGTSALELLAYATTAERPGDAERIGAIIEQAASARRAAVSAWQQIAINERAMLRLNILRLGAGATP
jgi:hypothetical protein